MDFDFSNIDILNCNNPKELAEKIKENDVKLNFEEEK